MNKMAALFVFSLLSPLTFADVCNNYPCLELDKVVFQVSAKQWVSTQTALLTVNVNATLSNADLVKARADIMNRLAKITAGEWHLTQFDRSQDSSGLEKLFVEAQARVPQTSLTDIYQNAKDVSKPGATYTINGVDFKPSLQEIQQIKSQLRATLYQQVNEELARINKVYTNQNYSVNAIYVSDGEAQALPQPTAYKMRTMNTMAMASAPAQDLSVSNEIIMSATVEAASNRKGSSIGANN
jgi:hypothetical protein